MIKILKFIILFFISLIERLEYKNLNLNEDDINKKILSTLELNNVQVHTDTGWEPTSHIHITQPYKIWKVVLENNMYMEGADNHILFDENLNEIFIKDLIPGNYVMTIDGPIKVQNVSVSRLSVSMFDLTVDSNNHRFYTNGILSHNTICSSIFLVHYLLFNADRNALLLSNKGATTVEIMDKVKVILMHLPFFLKPGVLKNDVMQMKFDNGCRLISQNTTKNSGIGFTIHLLFIDEFAHIQDNLINHFYENVIPTISSSKIAKIILSSTPNGFNKFYDICESARTGRSEYKLIRIDWWQVPGRDEAWMKKQISMLGSEDAFNRQFGNEFMAADNLLLSPGDLKKLREISIDFIHHEFTELEDLGISYKELVWKPDYDIDEIQDDDSYFIFSVDIAEGNGGDYTILNMYKVVPINKIHYSKIKNANGIDSYFGLSQIGIFRSNKHSIEDFAKILYVINYELFNSEQVKLVIEWNTYGALLVNYLQNVFPYKNEFDEESIAKFKHTNNSKTEQFGLKLKSDNKIIFCQDFKKAVTLGRIELSERQCIHELGVFSKTENGKSYKAQTGHDDTVMTSVNASQIFTNIVFNDIVEELFDLIDSNIQNDIDKELEQTRKGDNDTNFDVYSIL